MILVCLSSGIVIFVACISSELEQRQLWTSVKISDVAFRFDLAYRILGDISNDL